MRETVNSLRAYFLLAGVAGAFLNIVGFARQPSAALFFRLSLRYGPDVMLYTMTAALTVAGLGLACIYIFLGVRLKALIDTNPRLVLRLIVLGGACVGLAILADFLLGYRVAAATGTASLLVVWYLYSSARRLSLVQAEAVAPLP